MPVLFTFGPGPTRCTIEMSGVITLSDSERAIVHIVAARTWSRQTIVDMTTVTGLLLHFQDVHDLTTFIDARTRDAPLRGPIAIIAPNELLFVVAGVFKSAIERVVPLKMRVVKSLDEAEWWFMNHRAEP